MKNNLTIAKLQEYLELVYRERSDETGLFMKLVEEIGEVSEILNYKAGLKKSDNKDYNYELGLELADMLHYILAIAAKNNIPLSEIILEKDEQASIKYNHDINLKTFLSQKS